MPPAAPFSISVVLAAAGSLSPSCPPADTFDDGLFQAACVEPTHGWFVPLQVLRKSYAVPPPDVIAASRPMTEAELNRYANGGDELLVSEDHLLFAYPNQGSNAFLWTGGRDGDRQQVEPRVWNGEYWEPPRLTGGRADAAETVFLALPDAAVVHVLLYRQGGRAIRTERVRFARFPGATSIIEARLARADAVVWIPPYPMQEGWPRRLDRLKGDVDADALRSLLGTEKPRNSSLVFLAGSGPNRSVDTVFDGESGVFHGDFGPVADPEYDRLAIEERRHLRWRLARRAAAAFGAEAATLSVGEGGGEWITIELAIGSGAPGELYAVPITRSGHDGGQPLFRFEIRREEAVAELTTRGRFGAESLDAAEPESDGSLGVEYRFVRCGPGVVKLEIRPHARPWRGTVRAIVTPWRHFRGEGERVVTSPVPIAAN